MKNIFLVCGYGIPKDILSDENYNFYLKMVFNRLFDLTTRNKSFSPLIIFGGGETDMVPSYERNEAGEMERFFRNLISRNDVLKKATAKWQFVLEKKSLSTLENLLNCRAILTKRKISSAQLNIFCEHTRVKRIKLIAGQVFGKNYRIQVLPIDFDVSANRYLPVDFLSKKEKAELAHSRWALKSPANLKKHHQLFIEKMAYLRKAGSAAHVEAVRKWWKEKLRECEK